jgi:hypothetical protein
MSAAEAMRADPKLQSKWQDLEVDIAAAMQRFPDQLGDLDIEALNPLRAAKAKRGLQSFGIQRAGGGGGGGGAV